jgi:hypothetical protein
LFIEPGVQVDEESRRELLVQLMFAAAKSGRGDGTGSAGGGAKLQLDDAAADLFREYALQVAGGLMQCLNQGEKREVIDRVFLRLCSAAPGRGFKAPRHATSLAGYVFNAIRGGVRGQRVRGRSLYPAGSLPTGRSHQATSRPCATPRSDQVPQSIAEASDSLQISFTTVWRRMQKLGVQQLSPETWKTIRDDLMTKAQWQRVYKRLTENGDSPASARKAVYRRRCEGLDPVDVLKGLQSRPGSFVPCSCCHEAATTEHRGKHLCGECYKEKTRA